MEAGVEFGGPGGGLRPAESAMDRSVSLPLPVRALVRLEGSRHALRLAQNSPSHPGRWPDWKQHAALRRSTRILDPPRWGRLFSGAGRSPHSDRTLPEWIADRIAA